MNKGNTVQTGRSGKKSKWTGGQFDRLRIISLDSKAGNTRQIVKITKGTKGIYNIQMETQMDNSTPI